MALTLNDSIGAIKAPTGPNPQGRTAQTSKQTTNYNEGYVTPALATNQGVRAAGAGAQAQPQSQAAPAPPMGSAATYDYSSDPILQMVMGQQQMIIEQAKASALAQQKQALIQYGDPGLAMSILGDKLTADAAAMNPSSTLAQLAASNKQTVRGVNDTENKANLFYSSDRGYQLGLAQQAYLTNQSNAAGSLQGNLSNIGAQLLASQQAAWQTETQAQMDAANRAMQNPIGIPSQGNNSQDNAAPELPGAGQTQAPVGVQGVPVNAPGAATGKKPGKTVGGYIAGGAIRT